MFDSRAWQAERGNRDAVSRRGALVAALPGAGIAQGAPRDRVVALLGPADASDAAQDIYYLGRGGFAPDVEFLVIDYDATSRIAAITTRQG